ncbi:MAG: septal ring lytic transglycosylase RlpA family protein [Bacteroidota bacterium]
MRIVLIVVAALISAVPMSGQYNPANNQPELGYAVYYADYFEGQNTAMGEVYRKEAFTCAHKYHSKGTLLKVSRLDNNTSVVVRVNDRGPYGEGLIVDLSKAAAKRLDLLKAGKARVKLEVIGRSNTNPGDDLAGQTAAMSYAAPAPVEDEADFSSLYGFENPATTTNRTYNTDSETGEYYGKVRKLDENQADLADRFGVKGLEELTSRNNTAPSNTLPNAMSKDISVKGSMPMIQQLPVDQMGYAIQLGAFSNLLNAQRQYLDYQKGGLRNIYMSTVTGKDDTLLHRIVVAAFSSEQKAETYLASIKQVLGHDGLVIKLP